MLSRVLKAADVELAPVPWRRHTGPGAPPAKPVTLAGDNTEVARLRARIAELEAAVEMKSRQAYAAGAQAGEEAARGTLEAGIRETAQKLADTIAEVAGMRAETIRRAEADTVRLSIEIARRVLHRELTVDGSALEALIKAAMEKLQAQEVYRVRIHPDQEKLVRACLDQTPHGQSIAVVSDPVQPKGGAIFELSHGSLDASVETQLAEIEHGLIDRLEARA
jgi:flagellar assembly protein FliH